MGMYQEMVQGEAKSFFAEVRPTFEKDKKEFGGASDDANLSKWLDRTRKLFERLDEVKKGWTRVEAEMIRSNSRNSVSYGDPKESAYFAYYKDILQELKKLKKARMKP